MMLKASVFHRPICISIEDYKNKMYAMDELKNQRIVLVGAGNVATHIGLSLKAKGVDIAQVYSRTADSASALAARLGCPSTDNLSDLCADADMYIISVKDNALVDVIAGMEHCSADALYVHTAGSVPMLVFEHRRPYYGVFYPMQTFSKEKKVDFSQVPCFIEASDDVSLARLKRLAATLSSHVMELSTEKRKYLHLAAVFACNFANHCYAVADALLREQGIPFDVMLPLVDEAAGKVHHLSPVAAQTGPAVRGDTKVMDAQMQLLSDRPEWQELYAMLSGDIQNMNNQRNK